MLHIAYIDPDESSHFSFEQIAVLLRARGIANTVQCIPDLAEALATLPFDRPHVAFVDIQARSTLPPFNGLDLVRQVLTFPLCRHTVMVGMARYAMPADSAAAREAGCTDFLPKPLRYQAVEDLLVERLAQIIR